jgi:hypothetical protein
MQLVHAQPCVRQLAIAMACGRCAGQQLTFISLLLAHFLRQRRRRSQAGESIDDGKTAESTAAPAETSAWGAAVAPAPASTSTSTRETQFGFTGPVVVVDSPQGRTTDSPGRHARGESVATALSSRFTHAHPRTECTRLTKHCECNDALAMHSIAKHPSLPTLQL